MSVSGRRFKEHQEKLQQYGQQHLLAWWDELDSGQKSQLLDDLDQLDLERCQPLIDHFVRQRPAIEMPGLIEPPPIYPAMPTPQHEDHYRTATQVGVAAIRSGKVAAFTVAGGQGTRLGFDGPKGVFRISPIRNASLFQIFAESLLGVQRRYERLPRWYIMTSPSNHDETLRAFEENGYFGLPESEVIFFPQGQMPAFLPDGRVALAEKHRVALGPDGHGGSLQALAKSGALEDMRACGIEHISYFQVDNPLVKVIDPLFVGLHIDTGSEMSSKAVTKAHDLERVGNFCLADGKLAVIEYSDLPEELAKARNADGARTFDAGSIAIHVLKCDFVERLTAPDSQVHLPWHRAEKKLNVLGGDSDPDVPRETNVVKLETFVFDAIPLARNPLVLHTPREEEFSPVKNADGSDSPETARRELLLRAARWLEACGCHVPRDGDGEPDQLLEISPAFALDQEDLARRLVAPPEIKPGQALLLT